MSAAVTILAVGASTVKTQAVLQELARSGWESHSVPTLREAETVLRTVRFKLVLAAEKLPDGTSYELGSLIAKQCGNLFISEALSETCLWLPVVRNGVKSVGQRAMNPLMLATEAEVILGPRAAGLSAGATEQLRGAEEFLPAARVRCEPHEYAAHKLPNLERRKVLHGPAAASGNVPPPVHDDATDGIRPLGKRWRGL